ncbi:MAG: AraC family transcriptional regulator [Polyangiaceae bacterium]
MTDRVEPLGGHEVKVGRQLAERLAAGFDLARATEEARNLLRDFPTLSPTARLVRDLIERIETDALLLRVEQLVQETGMTERSLERAFRHHAGVAPKWVLRRYRLIEAVERLKEQPSTMAALAADLGYHDQAHFTRDFKQLTGSTPAAFARGARAPKARASSSQAGLDVGDQEVSSW